MCGEAALRSTFCLVSWCIFSKMSGRQEKSVGGWVGGGLFRFLVSWLTRGHMTRKRRWCGLASVLRDPCLTTQTCNLIYPISGAGIEAPVVMRTDKRTGCFIKEAFMSRVLEALALCSSGSFLCRSQGHCTPRGDLDHKAAGNYVNRLY